MLTRLETALCLGLGSFDAELQYVTEFRAAAPVRRKLRVLALHGTWTSDNETLSKLTKTL